VHPKLETVESTAELIANSHPWYAIRVQSKFERPVSRALCGKGYEEWLPLYRSRRQRCDRVKELDLPLFPGYLFCRFDVRDRLLPILTTPGVIKIVGAGKTPIPVSFEEIATIRAVIRSGLPAQPWPCLTAGSRVRVEHGPLAGVEGIVLSLEKECKLVVSIPLLQRAVAVKLEREWVYPIQNGIGQLAAALTGSLRVSKHVA
jgi:transcription antitermination factor NusG